MAATGKQCVSSQQQQHSLFIIIELLAAHSLVELTSQIPKSRTHIQRRPRLIFMCNILKLSGIKRKSKGRQFGEGIKKRKTTEECEDGVCACDKVTDRKQDDYFKSWAPAKSADQADSSSFFNHGNTHCTCHNISSFMATLHSSCPAFSIRLNLKSIMSPPGSSITGMPPRGTLYCSAGSERPDLVEVETQAVKPTLARPRRQ
ncbi:unnamed protein product [Pleuronectes platessa]|uniref:Uncharacterized protein n=1 Tax=Pleuronectes platessa TaxID=8262 RepID=A0A9N7VGF8_PLEPL|nr:unnamed protein product [Pleuronectes platessa]